MLGKLHSHEGERILKDTEECQSWKRERERNGDERGKKKVRRKEKE